MNWFGLVTQAAFNTAVNKLNKRIDTLEASEQGQVDTLTAQVTQVATDLDAAKTKLQAEIDSLSQANPNVDLTGLQNAVAPLDDAVNALGNLTPTPPAQPTP